MNVGKNVFLELFGSIIMEEVFWSLEEDNPSSDPETPSTMSPRSSQHTEHTIQGSPLWLVGGTALVVIMVVFPTDWGCWLPLIALAMLVYGFFEYTKTVTVSWTQESRHVEVFEGSRYNAERWLMLSYTSQPGDEITIESKPVSGNPLDVLSARDYWLVVKRKDGTHVASTEDQENSHFFAKRIKACLDLFQ